jgi:hypothetical protein
VQSFVGNLHRQPQTLGRQMAFFLNGREVGETVTVTLTMRDGMGNKVTR